MELVADFPGAQSRFQGFGFSCRAIFVGAADIEGLIAGQATITREGIARKHTTDYVTQVRFVVDIW